jgi:anti-sigma regulatory factor (Ser/Thr protein kinase)
LTKYVPARDPFCIAITESTQVGEARRAATSLAHAVGFDEVLSGQVAIVVTELANNIVRHARSGEVVLRSVSDASDQKATSLEVLALDRGPGIANLGQAFIDGFSTGSTPGTGLGAVKRLAADADIFSEPGKGTVVWARFAPRTVKPANSLLQHSVVCLPKPGEEACGDAWAVESDSSGRSLVIVADGLGHGVQAAAAAGLAIRTFRENMHRGSAQIIEVVHAALRSTRGAAVAVIELFHDKREIVFTGVGNISAQVVTGAISRSMVSHNGTAGVEARRIQSFTYAWPAESLLVVHSDGLASQWNLAQHPGLRFKHPSLIAAVLYRDCRRQRDDVTVLIARDAVS